MLFINRIEEDTSFVTKRTGKGLSRKDDSSHRDEEVVDLVPRSSAEKSLLPVIGSGAELITIFPGWLSTRRGANN
jgi:hypothetical protein